MSGKRPLITSSKPPLILIADDDPNIKNLLRRIMEQEGYRVTMVSDGQQCLDAFRAEKPDLVLLDAIMPVMDGFTCCQELIQVGKKNLALAMASIDNDSDWNNNLIAMLWDHTPILMITGLNDPQSIDRAFECGASDFVTKPIHLAVLRRRVRRLLHQVQIYKQLEAANQALQHLASIDGLTGVANRRHFDQYLNSQWLSLAQAQSPLSLILCDIDFFKLYNDKYGHPAGDICLQKVAAAIARSAEKTHDLVARYGGEEFAVILPNTEAAGAVKVAASMQAGVKQMQIVHGGSKVSDYVTLSIGVATTSPTFESNTQDLITTADKALYQAKEEGRNRIIFKQVPSSLVTG
ncbi:MAG: PleD family two-component system response regulator [Nostocaceae cyanobacterium]|nr:PleD family two-component system response regulator [Nostocaceae cyanobacterium]